MNYPKLNKETPLFYVEFYDKIRGDGGKRRFTINKRVFIDGEITHPLMSTERHPYNLADGEVARENAESLYTERYLKFLVDAMNRYHEDLTKPNNSDNL